MIHSNVILRHRRAPQNYVLAFLSILYICNGHSVIYL